MQQLPPCTASPQESCFRKDVFLLLQKTERLQIESRLKKEGIILLQAPKPQFFTDPINLEELRIALGIDATAFNYILEPSCH